MLVQPFEGEMEGRRYSCINEHDFIPPTVASLQMGRMVAMGRRRGGKPLFFGRGTVVVGYPDRSVVGMSVTDDDRALNVFAFGTNRHANLEPPLTWQQFSLRTTEGLLWPSTD